MKLGLKELDALRSISEQAELGMLDVSVYRDEADVGWLEVRFKPLRRGVASHWISPEKRKVSPLGHVYDEQGELVREGPALGPDGNARRALRTLEPK